MNSSDRNICGICRDAELDLDFETRCKHHFHIECLKTWFISGNRTCPYCTRAISASGALEKFFKEQNYRTFTSFTDEEQNVILSYCVKDNTVELDKFLAACFENVSTSKINGHPLIYYACRFDDVRLLNALVALGFDINPKSTFSFDENPLIMSVSMGAYNVFDRLRQLGADLHVQDHNGKGLLYTACMKRQWNFVNRFLDEDTELFNVSDQIYSFFATLKDEERKELFVFSIRESKIKLSLFLAEYFESVKYRDAFRGSGLILKACKTGNLRILEDLVRLGVDINEDNNSSLYFACQEGGSDIFDKLLELGSELNGHEKWVPLCVACKYGNIEIFDKLIGLGAAINRKDNCGLTPLHSACEYGHIELIDKMIGLGVDINCKDNRGWPPLQVACFSGRTEIFDKLIGLGADIDWIHGALSHACEYGNVEAFDKLIKMGADINWKDQKGGTTPLLSACRHGNVDVFYKLIELGADFNCKDNYDLTPFRLVCCNGNIKMFDKLIELGVDIHDKDLMERTVLHMASINGQVKIFDKLVELGADIKAKNNKGNTPLHMASINGQVKIFDKLIALYADANVKNDYGCTPLHLACVYASSFNHVTIVEKYIQLGVDVNIRNNEGKTALECAREKIEFYDDGYDQYDALKEIIEKLSSYKIQLSQSAL